MKRRSIIHLVESEEDNEGIISPCKKEGKNNGGEERKKSLNHIHGKKRKIEEKKEIFHSNVQLSYFEGAVSSPLNIILKKEFVINIWKNQLCKKIDVLSHKRKRSSQKTVQAKIDDYIKKNKSQSFEESFLIKSMYLDVST